MDRHPPTPNLYAYPALPRTGLGNLMIPWARAEIFAARSGASILAPQWTKPKIGPLLRGERDLRLYYGLFDNSGFVRGLKRSRVIKNAKHYQHAGADQAIEDHTNDPATDRVVVFRFPKFGDDFFGSDGPANRVLLRERTNAILSKGTRRKIDAALAQLPPRFIAMHVRRGDKKVMPKDEKKDVYNESIWVMTDDWYVNVLRSMRALPGLSDEAKSLPVVVFSDGTDDQIAEILAEPGVVRAPKSPSLVDIMLLSHGAALIGTATSSFSLWAGLFIEGPSIWYHNATKMFQPDRPERIIRASEDGEVTAHHAGVIGEALSA